METPCYLKCGLNWLKYHIFKIYRISKLSFRFLGLHPHSVFWNSFPQWYLLVIIPQCTSNVVGRGGGIDLGWCLWFFLPHYPSKSHLLKVLLLPRLLHLLHDLDLPSQKVGVLCAFIYVVLLQFLLTLINALALLRGTLTILSSRNTGPSLHCVTATT